MPTIANSNIPTPKSWDEFEDITLDAAKIRWASPNFYRNGRQGQLQNGVDIFSAPGGNSSIGIQCKNTIHAISSTLVEKEIVKAESFTPQLNELYIATTASRDASLQESVRKISKVRTDAGKFSVDLLFWEDISGDLTSNEEIFFKHYPQLSPMKEAIDVQHTGFTTDQADDVIKRVALAARELVVAARSVLQFSDTVVPVELGIVSNDSQSTPVPTDLDEVLRRTSSGDSILLFGEGGIGKTTAALELAKRMLDEVSPRIPIFVDAAAWSSNDLLLLDYVESLPSFMGQAVTSAHLARLLKGQITFIVNGWNEIPAMNQELCAQRMKQVTGTTSGVNVVLTARSVFDTAGLVSPVKVRVTGLSWEHQKEFIRSQLDAAQALELIEKLARNKTLRVAARNPLVLTGVVRIHLSDIERNQCSFNIFRAIVENYECEGTRGASLRSTPLAGMHTQYLEALACEMNHKQGTTLTLEQARSELTKLIRQLAADGQVTNLPNTSEVLQALCNHHLLFGDGNLVRFAHQRFQEYFAASHLFTRLTKTTQPATPQDTLLVEAINWPFWEDALILVAEKLTEANTWLSAKATLIEAASRIDLGIACILANKASLQRADDVALFDGIVNTLLQLHKSSVAEVAEYATACMIDTGFDSFADYLWPHLESDDHGAHLNFYRLGHTSISVKQLGPAAKQRIMSWPAKLRTEFVREVAQNPENSELIEEIAQQDESDQVRAAAIAAIAWDYPASEFALNAWKNAPDGVKLDHQVLSMLDESLLEAGEEVRKDIVRLATIASDDKSKVSLALRFPDWLGVATSDSILRELRQERQHGSNDTLAALARRVAPEQFLALAKELCLTRKFPPDWAIDAILELPSEEHFLLFESAWNTFKAEADHKFSTTVIGACANREQTNVLVREWFLLDTQLSNAVKEVPELRIRYDVVKNMLANVPGDDLILAVLELGRDLEYKESEQLVGILSLRIGYEESRARDDNPWLPTNSQIDGLIQVFWEKVDLRESPSNGIRAYLSSFASLVNASHYLALILDGCRSELDAWTRYQEVLDKWAQSGGRGHRPSNPPNQNYIISALVRCGFNVLTDLLDLITHPHAHQFVFRAIAQILAKPWNDRQPRPHWFPAIDGKEANARREAKLVMLQPDSTLQAATDNAARKLVERFHANLQQVDADKASATAGGKLQRIALYNCPLLMALAVIPSRECLQPLWNALARNDIEEYTFVDVLRSLVRQGVFIDNESVVQRMQDQWEKDASAQWLDQSAQCRFGQMNALLYFVHPTTLLGKPLTDYLPKWIQKCHANEVIQYLKTLYNDEAWLSLEHLAHDLSAIPHIGRELAYVLVDNLSASTFELFLGLLKDGSFFRLQSNTWELERMAGRIADVIGMDSSRREALVAICSKTDTEAADALACAVLSRIQRGVEDMIVFGLRILDNNSQKVGRYSALKMLLGLFSHHEPLGNAGTYEVSPRSCNTLRQQLFMRARSTEQNSNGAKVLLCSIEATRREMGRPSDEPRNPIDLGPSWSDALGQPIIQTNP